MQTQHNYRIQAEKIAIEAFLNFDDITKEHFFTFLREVYADKKESYQFFFTQYANLKVGKQILSKHQKKELLAVILPFLPLENQFYLLQCEIFYYLQEQKQYLTYRGKYTVNFSEFSNILSVYYEKIRYLHKDDSKWFHSKSYQAQDRNNILLVIRYVLLRKMNDHVEAMKQDFQTMLDNKKMLSAQFTYFFYFLELKILIQKKQINLEKIETYHTDNIPLIEGTFKLLLEKYIVDELTTVDTEKKIKKEQHVLFVHDLPTMLTHYQNTRLPTNQVKVHMELEGGAGKLDIHTKSKKSWEKALYLMLFTTGLISFFAFGISLKGLLVLGSAIVIWLITRFFRVIDYFAKDLLLQKEKTKETIAIYTEKYKEIIENKKEELNYIFLRDDILDKIKDAYYWKIKKIKIQKDSIYMNPRHILNVYKGYAAYIKSLRLKDIDILYAFGQDTKHKTLCLDMMKYLYMRKLEKSYKSFINLANLMTHYRLKFDYYMYFIDAPCEMLKSTDSFYDSEHGEVYKYEKLKDKINKDKEFHYTYMKEIEKDAILWTWLSEEIKKIDENNLEKEYHDLAECIKTRKKLFIIEGEEGALFYSEKGLQS